jgi:hypothetical protein
MRLSCCSGARIYGADRGRPEKDSDKPGNDSPAPVEGVERIGVSAISIGLAFGARRKCEEGNHTWRSARKPSPWPDGYTSSYRAISAELERAGHVNERGRPFHHKSIRAMLD